jgi:hypothetical protein
MVIKTLMMTNDDEGTQKQTPAFANPQHEEYSKGARRQAWKRLEICCAVLKIAIKCDNLILLPEQVKFVCAPVRVQLFTTPARLMMTCLSSRRCGKVLKILS